MTLDPIKFRELVEARDGLSDLKAALEARCKTHGEAKRFAEECGVSESFISAVRRGKKEPSTTIIRALGFRRVVSYRPLPPPPENAQ